MKTKQFGNSYTTDDNTGNSAEFLLQNEDVSAKVINRPLINLLESSEQNYIMIQSLIKTIYGNKNGILKDIYEELNPNNIKIGYFFQNEGSSSQPYIRLPSGAFIYNQYKDIAHYVTDTYGTIIDTNVNELTDLQTLIDDDSVGSVNSAYTGATSYIFPAVTKVGEVYKYTGDDFDLGDLSRDTYYTTDKKIVSFNFLNFNPKNNTIKNGDYLVVQKYASSTVTFDVFDELIGENFSHPFEEKDILEATNYLQDTFNSAINIIAPNTQILEYGLAYFLNLNIGDLANDMKVDYKKITEKDIVEGKAEVAFYSGYNSSSSLYRVVKDEDNEGSVKYVDSSDNTVTPSIVPTFPIMGYKLVETIEDATDSYTYNFPNETENTNYVLLSNKFTSGDVISITAGGYDTISGTLESSGDDTLSYAEFANQVASLINSQSDYPYTASVISTTYASSTTSVKAVKVTAKSTNYEITDYDTIVVAEDDTTMSLSRTQSEISISSSFAYGKFNVHTAQQYFYNVFDLIKSFWATNESSMITTTDTEKYLNIEPFIELPVNTSDTYYVYYNPDLKGKEVRKFPRRLWGKTVSDKVFSDDGSYYTVSTTSDGITTTVSYYPSSNGVSTTGKYYFEKTLDYSNKFGLISSSEWDTLVNVSEIKPLKLFEFTVTYNSTNYSYTISDATSELDSIDRRAVYTKEAILDSLSSSTKTELYNSFVVKDMADKDSEEIANRVIEMIGDNETADSEEIRVKTPILELETDDDKTKYFCMNKNGDTCFTDSTNGITLETQTSAKPIKLKVKNDSSTFISTCGRIVSTTSDVNILSCNLNLNLKTALSAYNTNAKCCYNVGFELSGSSLGSLGTRLYKGLNCFDKRLHLKQYDGSNYVELLTFDSENSSGCNTLYLNANTFVGDKVAYNCAGCYTPDFGNHPNTTAADTCTSARFYVKGNQITTGDICGYSCALFGGIAYDASTCCGYINRIGVDCLGGTNPYEFVVDNDTGFSYFANSVIIGQDLVTKNGSFFVQKINSATAISSWNIKLGQKTYSSSSPYYDSACEYAISLTKTSVTCSGTSRDACYTLKEQVCDSCLLATNFVYSCATKCLKDESAIICACGTTCVDICGVTTCEHGTTYCGSYKNISNTSTTKTYSQSAVIESCACNTMCDTAANYIGAFATSYSNSLLGACIVFNANGTTYGETYESGYTHSITNNGCENGTYANVCHTITTLSENITDADYKGESYNACYSKHYYICSPLVSIERLNDGSVESYVEMGDYSETVGSDTRCYKLKLYSDCGIYISAKYVDFSSQTCLKNAYASNALSLKKNKAADSSCQIYLAGFANSCTADSSCDFSGQCYGELYLNSGLVWDSGDLQSQSFTATSSRKLKTDIKETTHTDALSEINKINIVDFYFKTDTEKECPKVGFIAEDTSTVFSGPTQTKFDIYNSIGMLLKAVQELSAKNEELEKQINELKNK